MTGGKHQVQGQPVVLVTSPSVSSAGVGHRESGHSAGTSVLGHKYTGNTLLNIYSRLINLIQANVLGIKSSKHCCGELEFLRRHHP